MPITSTRLGSYWNLVIPCLLWSGLVPIHSEPTDAIMHYIERNGGLCMGLTRVKSARGAWVNVQNIDDLYVLRYALALLKRDEPNRALVSFYGKLAQGFTRDTFYDGESSSIEPLDRFGRHLPCRRTARPMQASSSSFATCWCRIGIWMTMGSRKRCGCCTRRRARGLKPAYRSWSQAPRPLSGRSPCESTRISGRLPRSFRCHSAPRERRSSVFARPRAGKPLKRRAIINRCVPWVRRRSTSRSYVASASSRRNSNRANHDANPVAQCVHPASGNCGMRLGSMLPR